MWRSSATAKRISTSPSTPTEEPSTVQDGQTSFRRGPSPTAQTILNEALKTNPFKPFDTSNHVRAPTGQPVEEDPVVSMNHDLQVLATVYPDVHLEVLRELLRRFDGESRLQICTEQLVKYKTRWAKGQLLNPPRGEDTIIPIEELFRSSAYIAASRSTLSAEFKSLNSSAIDAVLAEVNYSYTKARPVLQGIAARSWHAAFTSFFRRKKLVEDIPTCLRGKGKTQARLKTTNNTDLDEELEQLFLQGPLSQQRRLQQKADLELATSINQKEAEVAGALFECQVCYDDVPFEHMVTCSEAEHSICFACVRHSLHEALFGQGWAQSVNVLYGTLQCVAPGDHDGCTGFVPRYFLERIITSTESGTETWNKFDQRLATDSLAQSGLPLTQCPFCHYAESQDIYTVDTAKSISWRLRPRQVTISLLCLFLIAELMVPILLLSLAVTALVSPGFLSQLLTTSLINSHKLVQNKRFRCRNPTCSRVSCLSCSKSWYDPHTCHEPLILSLRTAVEAARTAALKRTCPRCNTSFVKSSGCNKLTCVCGYAMCYLCRKNIGKVNAQGAVDDQAGGEGYRHFCEHFRPLPGQKCTECNKCDLYMNENEEVAVQRAGEEAEKVWREKEGMIGVRSLGLEEAVGNLGKLNGDGFWRRVWKNFTAGNWTVQEVSDFIVSKLIIIEN